MTDLYDSDLSPQNCVEYQSKAVNLRFMGQVFGALTGATFLAALGAIGSALIHPVAATAAVTSGTGAMAAVGTFLGGISLPWAMGFLAVGLVCAYLSTNFYQQAQILDSDFNAKKIAAATHKAKGSPETEIAVALEEPQEKPKVLAPVINGSGKGLASEQAPETQTKMGSKVSDIVWQDRMQQLSENPSVSSTRA